MGPSTQNLKVEGLLRIDSNMWKVFTGPTCASDFFLLKTCFLPMKISMFRKFHIGAFLETRLAKIFQENLF
jgi:hypothetical protein